MGIASAGRTRQEPPAVRSAPWKWGGREVERMLAVGGTVLLRRRALRESSGAACAAALARRPSAGILPMPAGAGPAARAAGGHAPSLGWGPT